MATLNPILEEAKRATERAAKSLEKVSEEQRTNLAQGEEASKEVKEAVTAQGEAQRVQNLQQSTAELQAQNNRLDLYQVLGGDEALAKMLATRQTRAEEASDTQRKVSTIYEREPTGIGIIDGIINEFSAANLEAELRSDVAALQLADTDIQNFAAHTESINRVQSTTQRALNEATIAAQQTEIAESTKILAGKATLNAVASNAIQLDRVMAADARAAQGQRDLYSLYNQEKSSTQRDAAHKLNVKSTNLRVDQFQTSAAKSAVDLEAARLRLEEIKSPEYARRKALSIKAQEAQIAVTEFNLAKATKKAEEVEASMVSMISQIQNGQAKSNVPIEGDDLLRGILRKSGKLPKNYVALMNAGASDLPISNRPSAAAIYFNTVDPTGTSTSPARKALIKIAVDLDKQFRNKTPPKGEALDRAFDELAIKTYRGYAKDIEEGATNNPYRAAPFNTLSEAVEIRETPLYQKVLAPQNMKETSTERIFQSSIEAIRKKVITPEEAARGIVAIFSAAGRYNNTTKGFANAGLPLQTSYITDLDIPGVLTSEDTPLSVEVAKAITGPTGTFVAATSDRYFGTTLLSTTLSLDLYDYTSVQQAIVKLLSGTVAQQGSLFTEEGEVKE